MHMPLRKTLAFVLCLLTGATLQAEEAVEGLVPTAANGRPLNLDFESGTLADWKAEGEAFAGQPIRGDTVQPRRRDMQSQHRGEYWIGGYEHSGDKPQGTLSSVAFKVTQPYASFLIGGGPHETTCVELVEQASGQVIFRASGLESENLEPVIVDLRAHQGKEIFIRLVDNHTGGWGHINFDHFRLHASRPNFPKRPTSIEDLYPYAGLSPDEAARMMVLPPGFKAQLFAGEPDVVQPIGFALDDRGRLWVAEAYSYPIRLPAEQALDRILIFEDSNGDGRFDSRKVFAEKLNLVSGIEVGFGGVWVGAAPQLLFIPDRNGDDLPDGPAEVLLDGWGYQDTHETLNSFIWGPDGWLYGCHGVFTHSRVGKPGTPDSERVPINAGIWRYHPTQHRFEVFAHGTSNPWGVDFNDRGQAFLTCCVIPHLFHIVQGARYHRQGGEHFNPFTYDDIKTIAKHRHWVGNQWQNVDRARSDSVGGGHAHAGAMIYLGNAWPAEYRDQLFMNNIHGARINQDRLAVRGSGYVGDGAPDFLLAQDRWSQVINLRYGPDGQVYLIDWYDQNQCHRREVDVHDRSNGRIFKVVYERE
jgi:putative membrane-bound dehydrogenase-like protein